IEHGKSLRECRDHARLEKPVPVLRGNRFSTRYRLAEIQGVADHALFVEPATERMLTHEFHRATGKNGKATTQGDTCEVIHRDFLAFSLAAFRPSTSSSSRALRSRSLAPGSSIFTRSLSWPSSAYTRGCDWISWMITSGSMSGCGTKMMRPPCSPRSILRMPSVVARSFSDVTANRFFTW